MIKKLLGIILIFGLIGGALWLMLNEYKPGLSLNPSADSTSSGQAGSGPSTSFGGVSFSYGGLADSVSGEQIAAQPFTQPQPGGSGNPPYIKFSFSPPQPENTPPPTGKYFYVYTTDSYKKWLADNSYGDAWQPEALQQILNTQPTNPTQIPVAPVQNAGQVFISNVKYIPFKDGKGVRFVTSYAQSAGPVTNENLTYIYQGISNDGKYWVSFFYPVTTSALPKDNQAAGVSTNAEYEKFMANYDSYMKETVAKLNALPNSGFSPNLDLMDTLDSSIDIE